MANSINPRRWEWTGDLFDDTDLTFMAHIPVVSVGWAVAAGIAALSTFIAQVLFIPVWIMATILILASPTILNRVSYFRGLDWDTKPLMRKYLALSKEDRKEFFPDNYVTMIRNYDDLTHAEQRQLENNSNDIFSKIRERNRVIALNAANVRKAGLGTDDFFAELERRKQFARIEAETYRELM